MNLTEGTKGWYTSHNVGPRARAEVIKVWGPNCVNVRLEDGSVQSSVLLKQPGCAGHYFEPDQVDDVEQLIRDRSADSAPRVTKEDVQLAIVGETFTVLPSGRVTVCELTLRNGFTVRGESAVVFIENFNADIGEKIARQNAESQVWQLLGYELRSKRVALSIDELVNRFLQWPVPAHIHPDGTPGQPGRTGTNLLDASTAREMLQHVLGG